MSTVEIRVAALRAAAGLDVKTAAALIKAATDIEAYLTAPAETPGETSPKPAAKTKAQEPKVEEPKAEEPKAEEPKVEEPKAEETKAEEPKVEGIDADGNVVTKEQVRAAALQVAAILPEDDTDTLVKLLGAPSIGKVAPTAYGEVLARLEAWLNAGASSGSSVFDD